MTPLQRQLESRRREKNWSRRKLSLKAGLSETAVKAILSGKSQHPRQDTLEKLARVLECSVESLLTVAPQSQPINDLDPTKSAPEFRSASGGEARPADVVLPARASLPLDVPVMGTAAGADVGAFQIDNAPIDYVRCPPALVGAKKPYALYVVGDSMSPAIENGALLFVHPDRPPRIGDYVVIEQQRHADSERVAYVKRLRRRTEKWVFVDQFNPRGEQKFLASTVTRLHRVLTMNELFGV